MHTRQLRLCLFTQTPPVRFLREVPAGRTLQDYDEGKDYEISPGGVTRMVDAFLSRLTRMQRLHDASWVSLARHGPTGLDWAPAISYEQVRLSEADMARYARVKNDLWRSVHGLLPREKALPRAHLAHGFAPLACAMAERFRDLDARRRFHGAYVHDFQLLPLAGHLPDDVPRMFRWHIPFPEEHFAGREFVVDWLNQYDAVIASTHAYAGAMRRAGVRVPVHAMAPYLDERRRRVVHPDDIEAFDARWRLAPEDVVFLLVARMDPIKSQDVAIRALARLPDPNVKLVLVGGGGFSGGRRGGLGLSFAQEWHAKLEALASQLGVRDRVVFAGNLTDEELDVAFTRSRAVVLPSRMEGFGLAAVEGWLYGRPVLVSRGAGVAELVEEGRNGHSFDAGDTAALAEHMEMLAQEPELAVRMGEHGRRTARTCHLAPGSDAVWRVLSKLLEARAALAPGEQGERA